MGYGAGWTSYPPIPSIAKEGGRLQEPLIGMGRPEDNAIRGADQQGVAEN